MRASLAGERDASRRLLDQLTPVIRSRVLRTMKRLSGEASHSVFDCDDLMQEILLLLFAHDGRLIRAWNPDRGLSLENWVGLICERRVANFLRGARRRAVEGTRDLITLTPPHDIGAARAMEGRALLEAVVAHLEHVASERAQTLFVHLCVLEHPVRDVATSFQMTEAAVYAARARLEKEARSVNLLD